MTPNQRLMIAVVLSVLFFVGYSAIFPPEDQQAQKVEQTKTQNTQTSSVPKVSKVEDTAKGGEFQETQKMVTDDLSTLVTVKNSKFVLKIDTLGRISSGTSSR